MYNFPCEIFDDYLEDELAVLGALFCLPVVDSELVELGRGGDKLHLVPGTLADNPKLLLF